MTTWQVLTGDVREQLQSLPAQSVQTCVTSPPYWGLRDYGHDGQIGLEASPKAYVGSLCEVFAEVWRVLRDDGTVWLNLGDSYCGGGNYRGVNPETLSAKQGSNRGAIGQLAIGRNTAPPALRVDGLKSKDLVGIPWRVAFALQAAGWYLRSDIIWSKPNPMPESVTDRPTKAHEYLFLLSKAERYYYDAQAIREPQSQGTHERFGKNPAGSSKQKMGEVGSGIKNNSSFNAAMKVMMQPDQMRNKRSVWAIPSQAYGEAHFATFPEALIEPCILAGSKEGDTVLDPFTGSGTTGAVAVRHQRCFIGVELNPSYVQLARKRIGAVTPLFASEVA